LSAWVAYTNATGGLNGHRIRLIVGDDQGDPATAVTLTRRMVESDKIIAMVGNLNFFGFAQIEQYTREKNIPLIGGDAVDPLWLTSPNSFLVTTSTLNQTIIGLKAVLAGGGTRIGILYCVEVAALCGYLNDGVKKSPEVGSKVVADYQVSLVAPSYTSQCLRLKQAAIDVLYMAMDGNSAARAAQDCANQGLRPKVVLLGVDATKETPSIPALKDAVIPAGVFPTQAQGVPAIAEYRDVMAKYAPNVGDAGLGALAWAAGQMLGLVGKNLSASPTSTELYDALWKVKNETLGGLTAPITFTKGEAPSVKRCAFLWSMKDGKWAAPNGDEPSC
jgi:branched-chain amino acid transport system substrate-binding protein